MEFLGIFAIVMCISVTVWCFMNAPSSKEVNDYYEAIARETMHQLKDYDENLS